jgi:hypothetical protein
VLAPSKEGEELLVGGHAIRAFGRKSCNYIVRWLEYKCFIFLFIC